MTATLSTTTANPGQPVQANTAVATPPESPASAPPRVVGTLIGKDGRTSQVVSFRLGDEEYGVDIMTVQEIILVGCITQVPEVPEHVLGVINLRGNVIPILNLRRRFGLPERSANEATRIVVMNLHGRTVGVVVDGVSEVLRLTPEEISPPPASLAGVGKDYVLGLARRKDRLLILLDMARLLIGSDLSRIDHQGTGGKE
jgi:purine-binding chemotaxis protein CheW